VAFPLESVQPAPTVLIIRPRDGGVHPVALPLAKMQ
jgi:hypothetical protein